MCVYGRLTGVKTIVLIILIIFGCGRYCAREYGKIPQKIKIMHNYAQLCINMQNMYFLKMAKNYFLFFAPKMFLRP